MITEIGALIDAWAVKPGSEVEPCVLLPLCCRAKIVALLVVLQLLT